MKKSSKTTKVYSCRFPKTPDTTFKTFKRMMDAYAEKLKKELTK